MSKRSLLRLTSGIGLFVDRDFRKHMIDVLECFYMDLPFPSQEKEYGLTGTLPRVTFFHINIDIISMRK